ncbi:epidermal growth factor-like protein 7 isoform X2 [Lutzomyia longipalpis]|uniref:epidermal growth factor-like protein 7 isoform X2 n=1 Tax=Lutzomyia longipalpis TaxID=7200 RepID=UPI00248388BA|nr:epidermal growth factor-like protein 7 isoform X2 [Lutzomyia longipalpis]
MASGSVALLCIVGISLMHDVTSEVTTGRHNNNSYALKLTLINSSGFNRTPWWQQPPPSASSSPVTTQSSFMWTTMQDATTTAPPATTSHQRSHRHHRGHSGRHVCPERTTVHVPIKTKELFNKPTWRQFSEPCLDQNLCTGVRMVHEPTYRDVIRHHSTHRILYNCCPGWERIHANSSGCNKPVCKMECKNGGKCVKPDTCSCRTGFTGTSCELDINECKEEKPCDQMCYNTEGSYYCTCREGFSLQPDRQSCKKLDDAESALEAREMDVNDVDYDEINSRLTKLEKQTSQTELLERKLRQNLDKMEAMKTRLEILERRQYEISYFREKLKSYELQSKKIENLINLWYKCQKNPHLYCPTL